METERLVIMVRPDIKEEFHKATRQNGSNMTVELNRYIREYIESNKNKTD